MNLVTSVDDASGDLCHNLICGCGSCSYQDLCDSTGCWADQKPDPIVVVTVTPRRGPVVIDLWQGGFAIALSSWDAFQCSDCLDLSDVVKAIDALRREEWAQEVARRVARVERTWFRRPVRSQEWA